MKLVIDNTNVETIPVANLQDIGGMARALADEIDDGRHGDVTSVVALVLRSDGIAICTWGENASAYELMGIFEAAKLRVFADDALED